MAQPASIKVMETPSSASSPEPLQADGSAASSPDDAEVSKPSLVELFEQEESALLRYAFSMLRRREVSEEVVQDAFMKLHQHRSTVENPKAWVYRAVRNLCFNHLRKHSRESLEDEVVVDIGEGTPKDKLQHMEAVGSVRMLMAEMEPSDQELVRMKYLEGMSYSAISERTGVGVGNVGYKLHHLLKGMGEALRKLGVESSKG